MSSAVSQIGYVDIEVSGEQPWLALARAIGFESAKSEAHGTGLRMDADRWARIHLLKGSVDRLSAIGWEARSPDDYRAIVDRLKREGALIDERPDIAAKRNVGAVARFADPDGVTGELYCTPRTMIRRQFRSPEFVTFVAGSHGMGHVTLAVKDVASTAAFYRDMLGLKLTEVADVGSLSVTFLRSGSRHHSLALAEIPSGQAGVDHVMVEVATLDDLGAVRDRLLKGGHAISRDLGRHPTDGVVSLYVKTPASFTLEIGWGSISVDDDTWDRDRYERRGWSWGHQKPGEPESELGDEAG